MEKYAVVELYRCRCGMEVELKGHYEDTQLQEELQKTASKFEVEGQTCQHVFEKVEE